MNGTVRGRLTVVVTLVVGTITVTAALIAPKAVEEALVGDRLEAEAAQEAETLGTPITIITGRRATIGTAELTALFGPQIVGVTERLDAVGALARLRDMRDDGLVLVAPSAGIVGTVDADGQVRVEQLDADELGGPVITLDQLDELSMALAVRTDPIDAFEDGTITFEQFLAELNAEFGGAIRERLDLSVFDGFPDVRIDDIPIPQDVFDVLREQLEAQRPPEQTMPDRTMDDYVFAVRPIGNVEVIVAAPTDGIERSVERVRHALWIAVPLAMLLGGLATWLLAGRALRPVRAITARTSQIRSSTLFDRVPVPRGNDEIAGLANEMNTMLDRVQREDTRRRQFVADASHELRSPIAAIRTQAEAALTAPDPTPTVELAAGVLAEAERMGVLVDDLLALARHDEALAPPGTVVDLDDIVLEEARRPRRVPVETRRVSAGQVRAQPDELARVVTHLLDNAARHARERVAVSLSTDPDATSPVVRLCVDDDGPGVPVGERERIFERFVRLDEARERDRGGAGLGLAVVASVARSCGGSVTVEDSELGGARFVLTLPAV